MAQNIAVALLVAGCFVYALWTLGPKAARRRLAVALLKLPLPALLQMPLARAALQQGGCGSCGGCDRSVSAKPKSGPAGAQQQPTEFKPIAFVRGPAAKKMPR